MMLTNFISATIKNAVRVLTILRQGKYDYANAYESVPFGVDSCGLPNMVAIYSDTKINGQNVVVGWLNRNAVVKGGETRLYSTDSDGNLTYNVKLSSDGNLYLGTTTDFSSYADFLVKYNEWVNWYNDVFLTHTHETPAGVSDPPTVVPFDITTLLTANIKIQ